MQLNSSKAIVIYESSKPTPPPPPCLFCHRRDVLDKDRYGPILQYKDVNVHRFCLIFCHGLSQSDGDEKEISGYSYKVIKEKIENDSENGEPCIFCNIKGGTAKCAGRFKVMVGKLGRKTECRNCEKRYHYSCGRDNGCQFSFSGPRDPNRTFCNDRGNHFDTNSLPEAVFKDECQVCAGGDGTWDEVLKTVCCGLKTGKEYHKCCLQVWADKKGKQFQCLEYDCRDKFNKGFCDQMRINGIFISDGEGDNFDEDDKETELDVEMKDLPPTFLECLTMYSDDPEIIDKYVSMRNTPYNEDMLKITISRTTPAPETLWTLAGQNPPNGETLLRGGGTQISEFPGGSRVVLKQDESRVKKRVRPGYEMVFLVEEGELTFEYQYIRDNGIGRSSRVEKTLPEQTIGTIPSGVIYGLHNKGANPTLVFMVVRKIAVESGRVYKYYSKPRPRLVFVFKNMIQWFELYACVEAGWTEKYGKHYFVKLEPDCIHPMSMNAAGRMIVFVYKGEIEVRSTNTEEVPSGPSQSKKKASKKSQWALTAEVMPEKSVFEIPLSCCFILENWREVEACLFCVLLDDEVHGDNPTVQNSSA